MHEQRTVTTSTLPFRFVKVICCWRVSWLLPQSPLECAQIATVSRSAIRRTTVGTVNMPLRNGGKEIRTAVLSNG